MKTWPSDAVILICSDPATAIVEQMESVNPCRCRDCGVALVHDSKSMRLALEMHSRRGRPVDFLCIDCTITYDPKSVNFFEDHRDGIPEDAP